MKLEFAWQIFGKKKNTQISNFKRNLSVAAELLDANARTEG